MTSIADWVAEVRNHLEPEREEEANQLDAAYTAGDSTVTLRHNLGSIAAGARLSVGANTFRVFSTNPVAKQATISAGWQGTTDADAAAGSLVRVNPRFTDAQIVKALNGALRSLSSPSQGLFQVGTAEVAFDSVVQGYNLSGLTGLLSVLEVRRATVGPTLAWPRVRAHEWDLLRSAPTDDFAAGVALRLTVDSPPVDVQVVYAASFTETSTLADNVTTTGIPATAEDLPPLGAAIRLMAGREVGRNHMSAQGDSRRANEVPPSAVASSYRGLIALWAQRVAEENARLRAQYPVSK